MPDLRTRPEHLAEAALLSAVGGFLDAYTYLACGGVFANAQTGNVVLLGVELSNAEWATALRQLLPVAAFLVGVGCVEILARTPRRRLFRRPVRLGCQHQQHHQ